MNTGAMYSTCFWKLESAWLKECFNINFVTFGLESEYISDCFDAKYYVWIPGPWLMVGDGKQCEKTGDFKKKPTQRIHQVA